MSMTSTGLLLHSAIGEEVDETVEIQGHAIRSASFNLSAGTRSIPDRLL